MVDWGKNDTWLSLRADYLDLPLPKQTHTHICECIETIVISVVTITQRTQSTLEKKLCWKCKHVVNLFCHNSSLFWDKFINKRFFFSVKLLVQISKCKCTSREQQSKVWGRNLYCFSFVDADTLPRNYLRRWCVRFAERLVYYLVIGLPNYLSI